MNYFEYSGVKSSDMGLRIEKKNVFSAPKYDLSFQEIPGRNGDLIIPNGRYPNIQITYTVFLPAKTAAELADKVTAVKNWLYAGQDRYHELRDTYDTKFTRKAVFANKLNIEDELGKIGTFTVSFSCQPFRYAVDGQSDVTMINGGLLVNPYAFPSKPLVKIKGSGDSVLRVISSSTSEIKEWKLTGISSSLYIDSEIMNCYKGATPMNDHVSGDGFPVLQPGDNYILWNEGITEVKIVPRWCSL